MSEKKIREINSISDSAYQRRWKRLTSVLSILVIICIFNTLMLPATTLSRSASEHVHDASCYAADGSGLICGYDSTSSTSSTQYIVRPNTDTAESQRRVSDVIMMIDVLPEINTVNSELEVFHQKNDVSGLAAYSQKLLAQLNSVFDDYYSLTAAEQALVTNASKLEQFKEMPERLESYIPDPTPQFKAESGNSTANVLSGADSLPEGSEFVISEIAADSPEYSVNITLVERFLDSFATLDEAYAVDMHFADSDGIVDVDGKFKIKLNFEQPILPGNGRIYVLHIDDGTVKDITGKVTRTDAGITSVTIETDSFSPFVVARAGYNAGSETIPERLNGDHAYISSALMHVDNTTVSKQDIKTGTENFDSDDNPGNDSGPKNNILRTFDIVTYTIQYQTALRSDAGVQGYRTGTVYFEFILPLTSQQAVFDIDSMGWLAAYNEVEYEIVNVTVGGVQCQVLHGSFLAEPSSANPSAIGNSLNTMAIVVRAMQMKDGEKFQPKFTLWLEGNDVGTEIVNGIPQSIVTDTSGVCQEHKEHEYKTVTPVEIEISAIQRLNVFIKRGDPSFTCDVVDMDFSTGNSLALNKSNTTIYGRLTGYGIVIQIVGKDSSGLRGIEIPYDVSEISFDLVLSSSLVEYSGATPISLDTQKYNGQMFNTRIWSAAPNYELVGPNFDNYTQQDGRKIPTSAKGASHAAPANSGAHRNVSSCYDGGSWSFTSTSNAQTVHVTVRGFKFDLNKASNFPSSEMGHSNTVYYDKATVENAWDIQNACFSAAEIWVAQPFEVNGTTIIDKTDVNIKQSVTIKNFKVNGTSTSQVGTKDDQVSWSGALERPGSIESDIYYTVYGKGWNNPLTPGEFEGGYDWAVQGQQMSIYSLVSNDNAEGDNRGCAMELFVKFDENFFDPDGTYKLKIFSPTTDGIYWNGTPPDIKVLWVSRVYGRGWNNQGLNPDKSNSLGTGNNVTGDNYDWDMLAASSDRLPNGEQYEFFESLEALKAKENVNGLKEQCIGVLVEVRGIVAPGMNHIEITLNGKVRDDCKTGYVYSSVTHSRLWRIKEVSDFVRKWYKLEGSAHDVEWRKRRLELIDEYVRNIMPSHLYYNCFDIKSETPTKGFKGQTINNTQYSVYQLAMFEQIYWDKHPTFSYTNGSGTKVTVEGKTPNKNHVNNMASNLQKTWYKPDGTSGSWYNRYEADFCLVIGHETSISKETAQRAEDNISSKTVYSLDLAQSVVDYRIIPRIDRSVTNNASQGSGTQTTDVTIRDVLPKYMEYIPGSSYWGGVYTQHPDCAGQGTVTGGRTLEPTVTKNSDGTTTLQWELKGIVIDQNTIILDTIYYSARLTGYLVDGQDLKNSVEIWSTGDNLRKRNTTNNNLAIYGIKVQKSLAASLVKLSDQERVEISDDIGFTMYVGNNSPNDMKNVVFVDDLPHDNDGRSDFNGAMEFISFSATTDLINHFTFFYTTNPSLAGKTASDYLTSDGFATGDWTPIVFVNGKSGMSTANNIPKNAVQIVAHGTLPASRTLEMHVLLKFPDANGGDVVCNDLTMTTPEIEKQLDSYAFTEIVSRDLSGLTWLDVNRNGIQNTGELFIDGVNVTLYKVEGETYTPIVTIPTGYKIDITKTTNPADATRFEAGKYLFQNLPPGTYAIKFTSGTKSLDYHFASPVNAGNDKTIDSDGVPTYDEATNMLLQYTMIDNIFMPLAEDIPYVDIDGAEKLIFKVENQDSGFYEWGVALPETGGFGTFMYTFSGWLLLLTSCALLCISKRNERRGAP